MGSFAIITLIFVLALVHLGARQVQWVTAEDHHTLLFTSFAGGVGVAYVIIHLLPSLAHTQDLVVSTQPIIAKYGAYLWALAGFMTFYLASYWAKRKDLEFPASSQAHPREFLVSLALFALYNWMVGYLIGSMGHFNSWTHLGAYWLGYLAHFFANDWMLRLHYGRQYDQWGRYLLAASVLLGLATAWWWPLSDWTIASIESLVTGAFILNVVQNELALETDIHLGGFLTGVLGTGLLFLAM